MLLTTSPLHDDLAVTLDGTEPLWRELDSARVLLTGGTGFVGCWLLEAICHAATRWDIDVRVDVLSRHPEKLQTVAPHLAAHPGVRSVRGDVTTGLLPEHAYSHVVHAAIQTNVALTEPSAREVFDSSISGTQHVLDLCAAQGVRRFLLVSSGAVYDRASAHPDGARESDPLALVRPDRATGYAIGKAGAEFLALSEARAHGFDAVVARCFAFAGPYLPLDSHYAIGNFVGDAIASRPTTIKGDGTAVRSYMYGGDMALWLWTMLLHGRNGDIFNVGGDIPVTISELAYRVDSVLARDAATQRPIHVLGKPGNAPVDRYVPSVAHAREALGLCMTVTLDEAIRRTAAWATRDKPVASLEPRSSRDSAGATQPLPI